KWLADIHDMCCLREIDWPKVMEKAHAFGWSTLVKATLTACNSLFGTEIPRGLLFGKHPPWLKLFASRRTVLSRRLLPFRSLQGTVPKLQHLWSLMYVQTT